MENRVNDTDCRFLKANIVFFACRRICLFYESNFRTKISRINPYVVSGNGTCASSCVIH